MTNICTKQIQLTNLSSQISLPLLKDVKFSSVAWYARNLFPCASCSIGALHSCSHDSSSKHQPSLTPRSFVYSLGLPRSLTSVNKSETNQTLNANLNFFSHPIPLLGSIDNHVTVDCTAALPDSASLQPTVYQLRGAFTRALTLGKGSQHPNTLPSIQTGKKSPSPSTKRFDNS